MSELLKTINPDYSGLDETKWTLNDLVYATIKSRFQEPYAVYQLNKENTDSFARDSVLVVSHKDKPGGYGIAKVALSKPEGLGLYLLYMRNNQIYTTTHPNQTPLYNHRDSIHYQSVGANEFFFTNPQTLVTLLLEISDHSIQINSDQPIFPNTLDL